MNDTQMQAMSLERHHRILAHARAAETPTQPEQTFAVPTALPARVAAPVETPAAAPVEAPRTLTTQRMASPAPAPQLTADQAALLAASLGAKLPAEPPASVAPQTPDTQALGAPEMSEDQMSALMAAFGHEQVPAGAAPPQAAAAMAATAIPQSQDENLRYFPINRAGEPAPAARTTTASDTYLRAMQQMERNLGSYDGLTGRGR